jgi:hypothetical protein
MAPGEPFVEFRKMLAQVQGPLHPNRTYFILKSIVVNNLYGVDIMKDEALEVMNAEIRDHMLPRSLLPRSECRFCHE